MLWNVAIWLMNILFLLLSWDISFFAHRVSPRIFKYSLRVITVFAKTIQFYLLPSKFFGCITGKFDSNFTLIWRKRTQWPGPSSHKCQIHLCKLRLACLLGHEGMVISVQNSPNSFTFHLSSVMTFEAQFVWFS